MVIRRFWIAVVLVAAGIALAAQAQDDQPITPPTVDAAVSTLIAQTQQSPQHIVATQTIRAALAQALTGTAQALITPTATPAPFDAANLTLSGTTDLDLMAGPGGTAAYLAPDGEHFAYLGNDSLCIYQGEQQQSCVTDLDRLGSLDSESIRWSPDSRYLALTNDFFRYFLEPDIWVIDASSGTLTDITDDGELRLDFNTDWHDLDVLPQWTDDGQIVFLRYSRVSSGVVPPEIRRISPDGRADTLLGTMTSVSDQFAIWTMDVWRDKLIYDYAAAEDVPSNGVWISDLDGRNARQLSHFTHDAIVSGVQASPDGRYVLVTAEQASFIQQTPETSRQYLLDTVSGKQLRIDPERSVSGAGWSPQGSALVYLTYDPTDQIGDVYLSARPGKAGVLLLEGRFNIATPRLQQTLGWGANNTVLLSRSPTRGIVLMQLGS